MSDECFNKNVILQITFLQNPQKEIKAKVSLTLLKLHKKKDSSKPTDSSDLVSYSESHPIW